MKVAPFIIERFAAFIIGDKVFSKIVYSVGTQAYSTKTGAEKRAAAIAQFKEFGLELAEWLLNLGIELAVAWAKSKVK